MEHSIVPKLTCAGSLAFPEGNPVPASLFFAWRENARFPLAVGATPLQVYERSCSRPFPFSLWTGFLKCFDHCFFSIVANNGRGSPRVLSVYLSLFLLLLLFPSPGLFRRPAGFLPFFPFFSPQQKVNVNCRSAPRFSQCRGAPLHFPPFVKRYGACPAGSRPFPVQRACLLFFFDFLSTGPGFLLNSFPPLPLRPGIVLLLPFFLGRLIFGCSVVPLPRREKNPFPLSSPFAREPSQFVPLERSTNTPFPLPPPPPPTPPPPPPSHLRASFLSFLLPRRSLAIRVNVASFTFYSWLGQIGFSFFFLQTSPSLAVQSRTLYPPFPRVNSDGMYFVQEFLASVIISPTVFFPSFPSRAAPLLQFLSHGPSSALRKAPRRSCLVSFQVGPLARFFFFPQEDLSGKVSLAFSTRLPSTIVDAGPVRTDILFGFFFLVGPT